MKNRSNAFFELDNLPRFVYTDSIALSGESRANYFLYKETSDVATRTVEHDS